jgi:predicted branched-subunit amino acid permease
MRVNSGTVSLSIEVNNQRHIFYSASLSKKMSASFLQSKLISFVSKTHLQIRDTC